MLKIYSIYGKNKEICLNYRRQPRTGMFQLLERIGRRRIHIRIRSRMARWMFPLLGMRCTTVELVFRKRRAAVLQERLLDEIRWIVSTVRRSECERRHKSINWTETKRLSPFQIITGPVMVAGDHNFHPECFCCKLCNSFIGDGDSYALVERSKLYW